MPDLLPAGNKVAETTIPLRAETWVSSEARQEIHLFLAGTQTYVLGFNPELVDGNEIKEFLRERGFVL